MTKLNTFVCANAPPYIPVDTFDDAAKTAFSAGVAQYLSVSPTIVKIVSISNSNQATRRAVSARIGRKPGSAGGTASLGDEEVSSAVTVNFIIAVEDVSHAEVVSHESLASNDIDDLSAPKMADIIDNIDKIVNDPDAADSLTDDLSHAGLHSVETVVATEVVIPSPPPPPFSVSNETNVNKLPKALNFHADVYLFYFDERMTISANGKGDVWDMIRRTRTQVHRNSRILSRTIEHNVISTRL